ncbi:MAG TPA: TolC family protein [Aquabacterium sp.]|nr:TolC family protein [Aquabacterium sp.]
MNTLCKALLSSCLLAAMANGQAAVHTKVHKKAWRKPEPQVLPAVRQAVPTPVTTARGAEPKTTTRCRSELSPEALDRVANRSVNDDSTPVADDRLAPVDQLKKVAQLAIQRSKAVGAQRWLEEAASLDLDQTKAGRYPVVSLSGSMFSGSTQVDGTTTSSGRQSTLAVSAGAPLYDGGRLSSLIEWRKDLKNAANQSMRASQEAVVLEAVTTVLERNRYRMQAQVYQQHARKMACLVEALEAIVAEDPGRASELVQVRKTQAQAEVSRDSAVAQGRQIDLKLKRLLGADFVGGGGVSVPLGATPDQGELIRLLEHSPEALSFKAQSDAQEMYAKALNDGRMPQVNWSVSKSRSYSQPLTSSAWQAGVTVSYNLFDAGAEKAGVQAAQARAAASKEQYDDFISTRMERISSMHDNALTAFDRAKRYVDILRDSDLVRNFTFQQWSQLGRRSLFDLMSAESDHFSLRIAYVNSLYDGYEANAQLRSMGGGLLPWIQPDGVTP